MKADLTIKAGDKVRTYDFPESMYNPDRPACYVEGTVKRIVPMFGHDSYEIAVEKVVWSGEECAKTHDYVYPPVNGTLTLTGHTYGVVKIQGE